MKDFSDDQLRLSREERLKAESIKKASEAEKAKAKKEKYAKTMQRVQNFVNKVKSKVATGLNGLWEDEK